MVRVVWFDSCCPAGAWQRIGHGRDMQPSKITSVGFLARKDRQRVTLIQSFDPNNEGNLICIPRACVKKIKRLR